ncbi:glycoside hydrolase family 16 protein [Phytohabitans flavus]
MRRALLVLALVAAGLFVPVTSSPAIAAPGAMTWSDEFNGAAGSAPDPSKWRYDIGGSGWGNNEQQYYTNSTRNAAMDGAGNLVITARRENPPTSSATTAPASTRPRGCSRPGPSPRRTGASRHA